MAETGFRQKSGLTFKEPNSSLTLPLLLAALGGILQTLSWPQPGFWPLCFVALVPLILAVDGQNGRRAFLLGWVYGLSLSFSSLPWLAEVLSGYGGLGPVLGWIVLGLLAAFLALYQALFGWLITLRIPSPFWWAICGSVAWCGLDWLKNWLFTGFNWTPLAGPLALSPQLGQAADLVGFYGLGFFVALINFFLAIALYKQREGAGRTARNYLALAALFLAVGFVYGGLKYDQWDEAAQDGPRRRVVVVQPSTAQAIKWDDSYRDRLLNRYEKLAREAAAQEPWLTLWPETAMPFIYDSQELESVWLRQLMGEVGGANLVGVAGITGHWPREKQHNRMMLFRDGRQIAYYDKVHLVPFGEYLPLEGLPILEWAFMQGLIGAAGDYSPGRLMPPLSVPLDPGDAASEMVPLGVMICFESTFPYIGRARVLEGAELLVVPTNDGWFGRSRAPEQHLLQAAMRAVETRRPLVRAGNTGISAVIHPNGFIAWESELFATGAFPLETPLLAGADLTVSAFVQWGYALAPIMAVLTGLLMIIRFFRKQK